MGNNFDKKLTQREKQVMDLLSMGLTQRQVAGNLHVTEKTVNCHCLNIRNKLGAINTAQATTIYTVKKIGENP